MRYTRFTNCDLCDEGKLHHNKDLYIDNESGKIIEKPEDESDVEVVDLQGLVLAPGFLDVQNNGVYGLNFSALNSKSTDKDIKDFKRDYADVMAKYLATGVTAMCPTVTSNFPEVYEKVLEIYKRTRSKFETDCMGAHCEGPFISPKKKGCHPEETLRAADKGIELMKEVYSKQNLLDYVAIVTAAPEIPGVLDLIPELVKQNIVYSIGHTSTDYITALKAVEKGATMLTHLYNAMPQPHHRDVGTVGLISTPIPSKTPYYGIISDGVHVDPSMVTLAYRNNPEKCVLVTDAMHLIGLPDGTYKFGDQQITKTGSRLYLKGTKTLAGAATTLPQGVRNLMSWAEIPLPEAVKTVTNNPARCINVQDKKGFLNVGCDADLVVMDHRGFLKLVYKLGRRVSAVDENLPSKLSALL